MNGRRTTAISKVFRRRQAPESTAIAPPPRSRHRLIGEAAVLLVVAWPVVEVVRLIRRGSHLPWGDYWLMMGTLFRADGSTRVAGFFEFHNDHPVMFAKVLYWLNLRIGDGSNITLGYLVVILAVAQVLLLRHLLTRSPLTFTERSLLLVLSAALLFGMNGSWTFTKSMSGAAWLTANLFAVTAIVLRQKDRSWLSGGSAALAMISYGTGLWAWPAVAAVGLARRPWREWWRELPMVAGFFVGFLWYQSESHRPSGLDPTFRQLVSTVLTLLTSALRGDLRVLSLLAVLATVGLGALAVLRNDRDVAPWLGLAVYGLGSTTTIAYARFILIKEEPVSRYHSLAALYWIGATAMVLFAARQLVLRRTRTAPQTRRLISLGVAAVVVVGPMIALAWDITDDAPPVENRVTRQEFGAAALRLGLGTDFYWATGLQNTIDWDTLRRRGQYPYSSRWNEDCGLLGRTIEVDRLPEAPFGVINATAPSRLPGGVVLTADVPDVSSIQCVVAVAPDGEVVGLGVADDTANLGFHAPGARGYVVIAHDGHPSYRIVVFSDDEPSGAVLENGIDAGDIRPE